MKKIEFAISIGSSITTIYKSGVGVVLSDDSVVVTGLKAKKEVAIHTGNDALTSGIEYRRIVENGVVDFGLAKLMLEDYFAKIELKKKDGILFLVPLDEMKNIVEYKQLAYSLGINVVEVIPSIIATIYGYEIENLRKSFMLVDIGVNTEIAVVNNGRIVTGATVYNGGTNIDKNIAKYIHDEKAIEITPETSEKIKNELVTLLPNDYKTVEINGFIKDTTEFTTTTISSEDVFGIFVEEYSSISKAILEVLSDCEQEVNADIKRHGLYLCGASSKVVGIEKFFKLKLDLDSIRYKENTISMIGAGQLLDSPLDLEKVILENGTF